MKMLFPTPNQQCFEIILFEKGYNLSCADGGDDYSQTRTNEAVYSRDRESHTIHQDGDLWLI
jgi:hypothetical protein